MEGFNNEREIVGFFDNPNSGTKGGNFAMPVSEPSSLALFAAGLAAATAMYRRKKKAAYVTDGGLGVWLVVRKINYR